MFESSFEFTVRGAKAVCHRAGNGRPLVLLHGSGPGASAEGTWRFVLERLARNFSIYAPDLIGFGQSVDPSVSCAFDADIWLDQALALIDMISGNTVPVFGHSISGFTALRLPSRSSRVSKVLTTGAMGTKYPQSANTGLTWNLPPDRDGLRRALEILVHDKSIITDAFVEARYDILFNKGAARDFEAIFPGDKQKYIDACALTDQEIRGIQCPVLLVHGKCDVVIRPEDTTLKLAGLIPQSDVYLMSNCGHLPATERPDTIAALTEIFFTSD